MRIVAATHRSLREEVKNGRFPEIRELHNVIEYAFAVGRSATLHCSELPLEFREPLIAEPRFAAPPSITQALTTEQEAAAIRQALEKSNGRITFAARLLGMSRATFWRKRKLYGA